MGEARKFRVTTLCPDCGGKHEAVGTLDQVFEWGWHAMMDGHKMVLIEEETLALLRDMDTAEEAVQLN